MIAMQTQEPRFTRDGSEALERLLAETCQEIGRGISAIVPAAELEALILGGGYGRGEGGVLSTGEGDAPYNDLEFFVLIQGPPRANERRFGHAIHELGHRMTEVMGIEVEFKILSLEKLRDSGTTMFYYDLVCGHRVITGPKDILKSCARHGDAGRIPLHEATRLLMNRCSGLLFSAERLSRADFTAGDADFTTRNIAKAQLAMGDVVLAALGQYHWSCLERHAKLASVKEPALPMAELLACHENGVAFKLHPHQTPATRGELAKLHESVSAAARKVWMWLEAKRLGKTWASPLDYARDGISKCPETSALKNCLIRLRTFRLKALTGGNLLRYPREGLLNSLPLLLWAPEQTAAHTARLSRQLNAPVTSWASAVAAYARLWERYN